MRPADDATLDARRPRVQRSSAPGAIARPLTPEHRHGAQRILRSLHEMDTATDGTAREAEERAQLEAERS